MKKVKVIKDACIGCGSCAAICPDIFDIEDDGLATVKSTINFEEDTIGDGKLTDEHKTQIMDAIDGCPTGAIEMYE